MPLDLPDWLHSTAILPRTSLSPWQRAYYLAWVITVPADSWVITRPVFGFTDEWEWIPIGYKFSIWWACISTYQNSLIEGRIGAERKEAVGEYEWMARRSGYGDVTFEGGMLFDYIWDTRPVYYIANYLDGDIYVNLTVFGIIERV